MQPIHELIEEAREFLAASDPPDVQHAPAVAVTDIPTQSSPQVVGSKGFSSPLPLHRPLQRGEGVALLASGRSGPALALATYWPPSPSRRSWSSRAPIVTAKRRRIAAVEHR